MFERLFELSTHNNNDESYDANDCSICLSTFANYDTICKLSCNYFYHVSCTNKWF